MASPGNFDRRGRQNKDTARAWTFSCAPAPRLDTGGERERIGSDETGGLSALHLAVRGGHPVCVERLLRGGAGASFEGLSEKTPRACASDCGLVRDRLKETLAVSDCRSIAVDDEDEYYEH